MAKPPKNPKPTGPVKSKRKIKTPKGNPVRSGKIFGNPHNCSMPTPKK